MTQEGYQKSIETNELQLTYWKKFSHFNIVGFMSIISIGLLTIQLFKGTLHDFNQGELSIIVIPLILAILFYFLQKSRLKFKILTTNSTTKEIIPYLKELCKEWNWNQSFVNQNIFIAKTNFGGGSWGEQIIILFDKNRILVNSICDLDKHSSVVSFGRNSQNVKTVSDLITNINNVHNKNN